ncbi:MAG: carbohydrate porin [Steroidobacteraceae bacterium]
MEAPPSYEVNADFDAELWRNAQGGLGIGNRFLDHGIVSLTVNGETALGVPSLSFYGSTLFTNGQHINDDLIGSVQGISNIEAPAALRLYESWAEWLYGANKNSIKFGLYDVNSEFDTIETAGLFINPSHGIAPDFSQSGLNGPSIFPSTSLGLRSWHQRGPWTLQLAVLDGIPGDPDHETRSTIKFGKHDGLLLLAETGIATESGLRTAVGYWRYTAKFDDLLATDADGVAIQRDNNHGYYGFVDARLKAQQDDSTGLNAYIRYGKANDDINAVSSYLGGGIVMTGLPGRASDQLGLAVGTAMAGTPYREAQASQSLATTHHERITELTYFTPITPWLSLQPDIQYVEHAGFDAGVGHAWVFGLRLELTAAVRK